MSWYFYQTFIRLKNSSHSKFSLKTPRAEKEARENGEVIRFRLFEFYWRDGFLQMFTFGLPFFHVSLSNVSGARRAAFDHWAEFTRLHYSSSIASTLIWWTRLKQAAASSEHGWEALLYTGLRLPSSNEQGWTHLTVWSVQGGYSCGCGCG